MTCQNCDRQVGARVAGKTRLIRCGLDDIERESSFYCGAWKERLGVVSRPIMSWDRG